MRARAGARVSAGRVPEYRGKRADVGFDGTASLWYESETELRQKFLRPAFQSANLALAKDELDFVNGQRCVVVLGTEDPVLGTETSVFETDDSVRAPLESEIRELKEKAS